MHRKRAAACCKSSAVARRQPTPDSKSGDVIDHAVRRQADYRRRRFRGGAEANRGRPDLCSAAGARINRLTSRSAGPPAAGNHPPGVRQQAAGRRAERARSAIDAAHALSRPASRRLGKNAARAQRSRPAGWQLGSRASPRSTRPCSRRQLERLGLRNHASATAGEGRAPWTRIPTRPDYHLILEVAIRNTSDASRRKSPTGWTARPACRSKAPGTPPRSAAAWGSVAGMRDVMLRFNGCRQRVAAGVVRRVSSTPKTARCHAFPRVSARLDFIAVDTQYFASACFRKTQAGRSLVRGHPADSRRRGVRPKSPTRN